MIKAHIALNIYDLNEIVRAYFKERNIEVAGFYVMSWNRLVVQVDDMTMIEPVRHHLNRDHSEMFKISQPDAADFSKVT